METIELHQILWRDANEAIVFEKQHLKILETENIACVTIASKIETKRNWFIPFLYSLNNIHISSTPPSSNSEVRIANKLLNASENKQLAFVDATYEENITSYKYLFPSTVISKVVVFSLFGQFQRDSFLEELFIFVEATKANQIATEVKRKLGHLIITFWDFPESDFQKKSHFHGLLFGTETETTQSAKDRNHRRKIILDSFASVSIFFLPSVVEENGNFQENSDFSMIRKEFRESATRLLEYIYSKASGDLELANNRHYHNILGNFFEKSFTATNDEDFIKTFSKYLHTFILDESLSIFFKKIRDEIKEISVSEDLELTRQFNVKVEIQLKEFLERVGNSPRTLVSSYLKKIRSNNEEILNELLKSSSKVTSINQFSPETIQKLVEVLKSHRNKIKQLQELMADESELLAFTTFHDTSQLEKEDGKWTSYQSPMGFSILHAAVMTQDIGIIDYVLRKAPNLVYYCTALFETPLHFVARLGLSVDIMKRLIECGASPHSVDNQGWTPLHHVCHLGNLEATKFLVSRNADINKYSNNNQTALSLALSKNHFHVALFLVESEASIVHVDSEQLLFLKSALVVSSDKNYNQKVSEITSNILWGRNPILLYLLYRVHKSAKHNTEANDLMNEIASVPHLNISDTVRDRMMIGGCTFQKKELYAQYVFQCYTCKLTHDKGICINCVEHCHDGHDVSLIPYFSNRFYCDCSDSCKIKITPPPKTPQRVLSTLEITIETDSGSLKVEEHYSGTIFKVKEKIRAKYEINELQTIKLFRNGIQLQDTMKLHEIRDSPKLKMRLVDSDFRVSTLKAYLLWLIQQYSSITLSGIRNLSKIELPLEKIYVALRCDSSTTVERMENKKLLESEIREQYPDINFDDLDHDDRKKLVDRYLTENPYSKSVEERDLPSLFHLNSDEKLTLGEAFQRERSLVILGDPGAGKTTLGKWLCLKLAKAMLSQLEGGSNRLLVPADQVFLEANNGNIDLGPARLPIFIRAAEFTKARKELGKDMTIEDFLKIHTWMKDMPYYNGFQISQKDVFNIMRQYIKDWRTVLIVDGLDETEDRQSVVQAIDQYVKDNVPSTAPPPSQSGLNQVIVTSRIAGYHSNYLSKFTHVTIEHMDKVAIDHFSESWFQAVLSMTLDSGTALAQAKKFQQTIYNHKHPGIYEIATNPLIVTVLITLFYNNHGSIPEKRVLLYQESVDFLINTWSQKNMQMNSYDIKQVLIPVAAFMHDNCQTGLISRADLSKQLSIELSKRGKADPNWFINVLVDKVGLLVERGDGLFGFLHLTFEEFLAGMHLLSGGPKKAREQILAKLPNPRWHESIVLALGYASSGSEWSSRDFELLVDELLQADENSLSELLPRSCLLMATVLPEMDRPSTSVVVKVAQQLIRAYKSKYLFDFQPLRNTIEQAFSSLLATEYADIAKQVIIESLRSQNTSIITHTARLVREIQLLDSKVIQAVAEAVDRDEESLGWEVHKTLRSVVAPQGFTLGSIDIPYPSNEEVKLLEAQISNTEDENRIAILKSKLEEAKKKLKEEEQKYEKRGATLEEHLKFIQKQPPKITLEFPEILPFRTKVLSDETLANKIIQDIRLKQLIIALYGGYYDLNSPEYSKEYFEFMCYMQLDSNEKIPFSIMLAKNWGGDKDQVFNKIKAHVTLSPKYSFHKIKPRFQLECCYKDSPLTPIILSSMDSDLLVSDLRKNWTSDNSQLATDSLIASMSLSQDIDEIIQFIKSDAKRGEKILHKISSIWDSIRDPVVRATNFLTEGLSALELITEPRILKDIVRSTIDTVLSCFSFPLDLSPLKISFTSLTKDCGNFLLGEMMVLALSGSEESVKKAKEYVNLSFPDNFDNALQVFKYASMATFRRWNRGIFMWTTRELVEPNSPGFIELFIGLRRIDPDLNEVIDMIIDKLLKSTPNAEVSLFLRACKLGTVSSQKSGGWMTLSERCISIYQTSKGFTDSYLSVLIHAICSKYNYNMRFEMFQEGWQLSEKIEDSLKRFQAREFLLMCASPKEMNDYINQMKKDVDLISSNEDRAVSLARISLWFPSHEQQIKCLSESLDAIDQISDLNMKVEIQRQLANLFLVSPDLHNRSESMARKIQDPLERNRALGYISPLFNESVDKTLQNKNQSDLWSPVILASKIIDIQRGLSRFMYPLSMDIFWKTLLNDPFHPKVKEILQDYTNRNQSIQMTSLASLAFNKLLAHQDKYSSIIMQLCPLLRHANEDSIPLLMYYLRSQPKTETEKFIQPFAALLRSEAEDMTEETAPFMVNLAENSIDIVRLRTRKIFVMGMWSSWNYHYLLRNISVIGGKILKIIRDRGIAYYDEGKPGIGVGLGWYFQTVFVDSPEIIQKLITDASSSEKAVSDSAKSLIRALESVAENCENEFLRGLRHSDEEISSCFFKALTVVAERGTARKEFYPKVREAILSLTHFPNNVRKLIYTPNVCVSYAALIEAQELAILTETSPQKRLMQILQSGVMRDTLNILQSTTNSNFSKVLHNLGSLHLVSHSELDLEAEQISYLVQNNPKLLDVLIDYLEDDLKSGREEDLCSFLNISMNLLIATAAAAQCMPSKFVNLVKQHKDLRGLLRDAAQKHGTFPGRQGAIFLLSLIGKWDKDVSQLLKSCLYDVYYVAQTALDLPLHVKVIEDSAIEELKPEDQLQSSSALLSYSIIQLLTMFALKPTTSGERRVQIMELFASAIQDQRSLRTVQLAYPHCSMTPLPVIRDILYQALVDISGFTIRRPSLVRTVTKKINKENSKKTNTAYAEIVYQQLQKTEITDMAGFDAFMQKYKIVINAYGSKTMQWCKAHLFALKTLLQFLALPSKHEADQQVWEKTLEFGKKLIESPHYSALLLTEKSTLIDVVSATQSLLLIANTNNEISTIMKQIEQDILGKVVISAEGWIRRLNTSRLLLDETEVDGILKGCINSLEIATRTTIPTGIKLEDYVVLTYQLLLHVYPLNSILVQSFQQAVQAGLAVRNKLNDSAIEMLKEISEVILCMQEAWDLSSTKTEASIDILTQGIKKYPKSVALHNLRGHLFSKLNKTQEMIADFSVILEINPKYYPAWKYRGNGHFQLEDYDKASRDYSYYLEFDHHDSGIILKRGKCNMKLLRFKEALVDLLWHLMMGDAEKALTEFAPLINAVETFSSEDSPNYKFYLFLQGAKLLKSWGASEFSVDNADKACQFFQDCINVDQSFQPAWVGFFYSHSGHKKLVSNEEKLGSGFSKFYADLCTDVSSHIPYFATVYGLQTDFVGLIDNEKIIDVSIEKFQEILKLENPATDFVEYLDRKQVTQLARSLRFKGIYKLGKSQIQECQESIKKAIEIVWGVEAPFSYASADITSLDNIDQLSKALSSFFSSMHILFSYKDEIVSYSEVFSPTGLLPPIIKRAQELAKLLTKSDLGVTFTADSSALTGTTVRLSSLTRGIKRFFPIVCILLDCATPSQTKCNGLSYVVSLDEMQYD